MPRKNLPSYVQRVRSGDAVRFRGWAMVEGRRVYGPLRTDADKAHADAMSLRRAAQPVWCGSFETAAETWLAEVLRTRAPDTAQFYRACLNTVWKVIPKVTAVDLISATMVRVFALNTSNLPISARTIHHCGSVLHNFFGWLIRTSNGAVVVNPVDAVSWPRVDATAPDVLTEDELAGILQRIDDPWARALVVFMAYTGLRRAEMARVAVADVQADGTTFWIRGKTKHTSHPIPEHGQEAGRLLVDAAKRERRAMLIPGPTDNARRCRIGETFRYWQRILKEPRLHPHTLRHSIATILLRRGVNPAVVQRFLRHSSYAVTQRYVHMVEDDVREAASDLRLLGDVESLPVRRLRIVGDDE